MNKLDTANAPDERIDRDYMELSPAYGRDYKNKKSAEEAFRQGLDWVGDYNIGFAYCSVRDFKPGVAVLLRYAKCTKVTSIKV